MLETLGNPRKPARNFWDVPGNTKEEKEKKIVMKSRHVNFIPVVKNEFNPTPDIINFGTVI